MKNLPPKQQEEWRKLLTGEIDVPLQNFYFKTKVLQLREQINLNKISIDEGVDEIYQLVYGFCQAKYVAGDIERIFGVKIKITPVETEEDSTEKESIEQNNIKPDETNNLQEIQKIETAEKIKSKPIQKEEKNPETEQITEKKQTHTTDKKKVQISDAIAKQKDLKFQPKETPEKTKTIEKQKPVDKKIPDLEEERKKVRAEIEKRIREIEENKKNKKNPKDILKEIKKNSEIQKQNKQTQIHSHKTTKKKNKKSFWRDLFDL